MYSFSIDKIVWLQTSFNKKFKGNSNTVPLTIFSNEKWQKFIPLLQWKEKLIEFSKIILKGKVAKLFPYKAELFSKVLVLSKKGSFSSHFIAPPSFAAVLCLKTLLKK